MGSVCYVHCALAGSVLVTSCDLIVSVSECGPPIPARLAVE